VPDLVGYEAVTSAGTIVPAVSTTSGTHTFNLDIVEMVEEAYEQAGLELRSGYDLKTARRSMNLLALDWANRGYNLWVVEEGSIPLASGMASYLLPADTIDIVEMVLRTTISGTSTDIAITRVGMSVYATIPVKTTMGRPVQVWVDRQTTPRVVFWPVPSGATYTFVYWRLRRIQDVGATGELTMDIPQRFIPCFVAGLALKIAGKRPEAEARIERLKTDYEEQWNLASTEDREKVSTRLYPPRMSI
jgi:hypothetical protein